MLKATIYTTFVFISHLVSHQWFDDSVKAMLAIFFIPTLIVEYISTHDFSKMCLSEKVLLIISFLFMAGGGIAIMGTNHEQIKENCVKTSKGIK